MIGLLQRIKAPPPKTRPVEPETLTPPAGLPAPVPAGMGPEYEKLWNAAHRLSDEIDDPANGTVDERRARLPELFKLQERMAIFWNRKTDKTPPAGGEWQTP